MGVLDSDENSRPAATAPPARAEPGGAERRRALLLIVPTMIFWGVNQLASALLPVLATENTTLLIALSSSNRYLIIAAASAKGWLDAGNAVPLVLFAAIGFVRLMAPDVFIYALGERYGDRAISWMERRTPTFGELLRDLEKLFAKAGPLVVLFTTNVPVCLLAGAAGMRKSLFWSLNVVGTIGRLIVMWFVGQALQEWIDVALGFVSEHRLPFLVLSVGLVSLTMLREWRAGTTGAQSLMELEHEIEEDVETDLSALADRGWGDGTEPVAGDDDGRPGGERPATRRS